MKCENIFMKCLASPRKDKREHVYTLAQFDRAKTHEDLWNAAQVHFFSIFQVKIVILLLKKSIVFLLLKK